MLVVLKAHAGDLQARLRFLGSPACSCMVKLYLQGSCCGLAESSAGYFMTMSLLYVCCWY